MNLEMTVSESHFDFDSDITSAIKVAEQEIIDLQETLDSISYLKADCDKVDYVLAACSGALCGIIDIFLVDSPNDSFIGDKTDDWFESITIKFAKQQGWNPRKEPTINNAISFLEAKFKIPYDQTSWGEAGKYVFGNLNSDIHHFKSLSHNPSLCGLFFSIVDQWNNTSHFISNGQLVSLMDAGDGWELKGENLPSKLFCGFANWFGHLISDNAGSSRSSGRGMGLPSPFWTWTNDLIAIKAKLNIPVNKFEKEINELALNIFSKGFDARFQTAQAIPVFVNETITRFFYSIRRFIQYVKKDYESFSFQKMWKTCEPFSNPTVKRMLTVAHGTFCILDLSDATIHGFASTPGAFNVTEFVLRLNIIGIGRFAVSLYGEAQREIKYANMQEEVDFTRKELIITEYYLEGLRVLQEKYEDEYLLTFIDDLKNSEMYIIAFQKSAQLAYLRDVPEKKILKTKRDIDSYFGGTTKI